MSLLENVNETNLKLVPDNDSVIQNYFVGKTVFVTGATGSLGKLVVEKLLRSCKVEKIYILVRAKKGKEPHDRIKELFEIPAFEPLKKQMPNFSSKVSLFLGDCLEPKLGLSQDDLEILINDVHCIFHCAATVRFDATLRNATYINVRATWDLLKIAKEMKQLTSFVHVSTAYSHCPRRDIDEVFYEPPMTAQKLLDLVEALEDDTLEAINPSVIKEWPNTYVFTKAIAEHVVKTEGNGLPVSIVRPSMILASFKEPVPGWVDNFYGLIGLSLGCGLGVVRTAQCCPEKIIDIVPLDYVVNTILAAAWNGSKNTSQELVNNVCSSNKRSSIIYNCVSGTQNAISYEEVVKNEFKAKETAPTSRMVLYPSIFLTSNLYLHLLLDFLFHKVLAYLVDFVLLCLGRKTFAVDVYKKIKHMSKVLVYFSTKEWKFKNTNVQDMWNKLHAKDKELFEFDMKLVDWEKYFEVAILGGRIYLLKDPPETVPRAKQKLFLLRILHYILMILLIYLLYLLIHLLYLLLKFLLFICI